VNNIHLREAKLGLEMILNYIVDIAQAIFKSNHEKEPPSYSNGRASSRSSNGNRKNIPEPQNDLTDTLTKKDHKFQRDTYFYSYDDHFVVDDHMSFQQLIQLLSTHRDTSNNNDAMQIFKDNNNESELYFLMNEMKLQHFDYFLSIIGHQFEIITHESQQNSFVTRLIEFVKFQNLTNAKRSFQHIKINFHAILSHFILKSNECLNSLSNLQSIKKQIFKIFDGKKLSKYKTFASKFGKFLKYLRHILSSFLEAYILIGSISNEDEILNQMVNTCNYMNLTVKTMMKRQEVQDQPYPQNVPYYLDDDICLTDDDMETTDENSHNDHRRKKRRLRLAAIKALQQNQPDLSTDDDNDEIDCHDHLRCISSNQLLHNKTTSYWEDISKV
jgi:hypothetical protein